MKIPSKNSCLILLLMYLTLKVSAYILIQILKLSAV